MLRADVLEWMHRSLRPKLYVEIGIRDGASLRHVLPGTSTIGIDPAPRFRFRWPWRASTFMGTSDAFFQQSDCSRVLSRRVDFGFIDGMHLFEYALRDFINLEKHARPDGVIVFDDPYPKTDAQANRDEPTGDWAGDVWRAVAALRQVRPDLAITTLDTPPTGLTIVTGLNPGSTVLSDSWDRIHAEMMAVPYSEAIVRDLLRPVVPTLDLLHRLLPERRSAFPPVPVAIAGRALRPPHLRNLKFWAHQARRKIRPRPPR